MKSKKYHTFRTVPNCNRQIVEIEAHFPARGRRRRDRLVVGFTTIYAICVYHH